MELVKKNWLSIVFGVIALLAIIADFYPMGGMRTKLTADAAERAAMATKLRDLASKERKMPIVNPGSTEAPALPAFPTEKIVAEGVQKTKLVDEAANKLMADAARVNEHTPLVPGALPGAAGNTLPASDFARNYMRMFPPSTAGGTAAVTPNPATATAPPPAVRPKPEQGRPATLMQILGAVNPPTDLELTLARDARQKKIIDENTRYATGGQVANQEEVQALVQKGLITLIDELRSASAKAALCYVGPDAFAIYTGMSVQAVPGPTDIFWAQIGLWVQEDLCKAIFELNNTKPSVMEAPVKMVSKVYFINNNSPTSGQNQPTPIPVFALPGLPSAQGVGNNPGGEVMPTTPMGGMEGGMGMGMDPNAPAPPALPTEPTKNTLLSPTGRQSNALFDVTQFEIELIVDAASVSQVIEGLGAKQYICITQVMALDAVDSAQFRGAGYYFGDKPCVKIRLRGEELFFRSWLEKFVPTRLKTNLSYPAAQPAAPTA